MRWLGWDGQCLKPNSAKQAQVWVEEEMAAQLKYTGVLALCKLRQVMHTYCLRLIGETCLQRCDFLRGAFRALVVRGHGRRWCFDKHLMQFW